MVRFDHLPPPLKRLSHVTKLCIYMSPTIVVSFLLLLVYALITETQQPPSSIDIPDFPGYNNLRACAQQCLRNDVQIEIGCGTNDCLCNHEADSLASVVKCVNLQCASSTADVNSATSIFVAYCSSYEAAVQNTGLSQSITSSRLPSATPGNGGPTMTTDNGNARNDHVNWTADSIVSTASSTTIVTTTNINGQRTTFTTIVPVVYSDSQSNKIALGVGIGIGVPGAIAALITIYLYIKRYYR